MATKKTKDFPKGIITKAVQKTKEIALNANATALAKTEEFVSTSIEVAEQWQNVTEKALKGGLKLAANQQDLVFDILNEIKADFKEGKKRFSKLVA